MDFITLISADDQVFTIDVDTAEKCITIKNLIDDIGIEKPIPLSEVTGKCLKKILYYGKNYNQTPDWETEFFNFDQETLFELILASNYLDYKDLLDSCCKKVSEMIKGKTPEEIRKTFNIANDFTAEEEKKLLDENQWIEEN